MLEQGSPVLLGDAEQTVDSPINLKRRRSCLESDSVSTKLKLELGDGNAALPSIGARSLHDIGSGRNGV